MLNVVLLIVMECGWTQWLFLVLMVPGTCSVVTVHQPPVLATALGHNVIMPCHLSSKEKLTPPVLYWVYNDNSKLWPAAEKYKERVDLLDKNPDSSNKSILFKNVQWADSGMYLCKLSIITTDNNKRSRTKGNETLLIIYDTMTFNLNGHNDSQLCCLLKVTPDPGLALSIFHDGVKAQSNESATGDRVAATPYVTLSETISLRGAGEYECQLYLNKHLITKSVFHYHPTVAKLHRDAGKNVTATAEPWLLYGGLLLVPVIVLLLLGIVLLLCRVEFLLKKLNNHVSDPDCQEEKKTIFS